ncbi:MAG: PTS glucose transporter subunit IIA [Holdemanella sp.]|nr:PTS glucose transporter subunit IIA [Holdemanella sp.]
MSKYGDLINGIVRNIGGKENIASLTHCVTRLRFQLKDDSKANEEVIKNLDGVITVMRTAGQFQVVIGNHVGEVYKEICDTYGIDSNASTTVKKKMTFKEKMLDLVSGIFMPSISMLCASGMLKGVLAILVVTGVMVEGSGFHTLFSAIADAVFYFFPVVIGYNAAKKFGCSPFLGMVIGCAFVYPTISGVDLEIFGQVVNNSYSGTVFPIILTIALAAPMEKALNKVIPNVISSFMTPMIVLAVATSIGFLVIGPVANGISAVLSEAILGIYNISPMLGSAIFGGLWLVLVVFGVHMAFIVLCIMNLGAGIPDPLLAASVFTAFAQGAVVLAIYLKTKNKSLKDVCIPAFISCIFGVTEPAIYGISLPRIKMFLATIIASAAAGAWSGLTGLKYYQMAGMGIFEYPALFPPTGVGNTMINALIATAIAVVVGFVLAYILYKDEDGDTVNDAIEAIAMPLEGKVKSLKEVKDDAFAQGVLGKGCAIEPSKGEVRAPFDGTIMTLFPTKHAIGIVSNNGCEVLIHIGMDTVQLNGQYFEAFVKQGDKVKQGQLLVTFDIDKIKEAGYSVDTPVIVTNTSDYRTITTVNNNGVLLTVTH